MSTERASSNQAPQKSGDAPKTSKIDPARYSQVVAAAELSRITLVASQFRIAATYYAFREKLRGKGSVPDRLFDCDIKAVAFNPDEGSVGATFNWHMEVKSETETLLDFSCDYICVYSGLKGLDEEAAKFFVRRVGKFATFPYFRALASQLNCEAQTDLPPLPVLRETKPIAKNQISAGKSG